MLLVKVLEKKLVIQFFGMALLLAPAVNTLAKMSMLTEIPNRWSWAIFWKIIQMGSTPNQILYVATIIIGILMLRGRTTVWKFSLMLLGGYIALQISDFGHVRTSWVTWLFFITNVVAFLFVADQLVWKVKAHAPVAKATPAPAPRAIPQVRKKILFQFAGNGPWAQLMGVSNKGLHVRSLHAPPQDIATREVEISLGRGLNLRTRLSHHKEHDYYFDYTRLSPEEIKSLNQWLQSLSKAA